MSTKTNTQGLSKVEYKGGKSTLCTGCGHDSITNHIMSAYFQANVNPYDVAKLSGIGCSSKTPAYFLNRSHGFNSLHGRMAPLATGVNMANKNLKLIGISGDGDTASIGLGGFAHLIRRNVPIVYLCYNNGVYGLTKGQFSATSEKEATLKDGTVNHFGEIDLCSLAINLGCGFVARSFSGDAKQLVPLIQAAIHHNGTAFIDIISPCITFNNHDSSSKSFVAVKDHKINLQELGIIEAQSEISVDYEEGSLEEIEMHDGTILTLKKIDSKAHDVHNRLEAMQLLAKHDQTKELLTGLFFIDEKSKSLPENMNLIDEALHSVNESSRPDKESFAKIINSFQ